MTNSAADSIAICSGYAPPFWTSLAPTPVALFAWATLAILILCFILALLQRHGGAWFLCVAHIQLLCFVFLIGIMGSLSTLYYMSGTHLAQWAWDLQGILTSLTIEAVALLLMVSIILRRLGSPLSGWTWTISAGILTADMLLWFALVSAIAGLATGLPKAF